jgi:hypothetical protein
MLDEGIMKARESVLGLEKEEAYRSKKHVRGQGCRQRRCDFIVSGCGTGDLIATVILGNRLVISLTERETNFRTR